MSVRTLLVLVGVVVLWPANALAQVCRVPDSVRALVPMDPLPEEPYEARWVASGEGQSVPLGIGHVFHSDRNAVADLPPGADDWLQRVALPLSSDPGDEPFGWIVAGWIVGRDLAPQPLSTRNLVETGYEEVSFVVLEARSDWLRLSYGSDGPDVGTAWVPHCALSEGPVVLDFAEWSAWLLSDRVSPLFFRSETPGPLHSGASQESSALPAISGDYILEPLEIRGDWMRVAVKEPSDYCEFDLVAARREGWVRWNDSVRGPLLWYFTRGC